MLNVVFKMDLKYVSVVYQVYNTILVLISAKLAIYLIVKHALILLIKVAVNA